MRPKIVLVAGSRPPSSEAAMAAYNNLLGEASNYIESLPKGTVVLSASAAGVDGMVQSVAKRAGLMAIAVTSPPGRAACEERDRLMVSIADEVAAFVLNRSRGTSYLRTRAEESGKLVHLVELESR